MASRKFPFAKGSTPGRDGFIRIPEGGGGGASAGGRAKSRASNAELKKYGVDPATRKQKAKEATQAFMKNVETLSGRDALTKIRTAMFKEKRLAKIERARDVQGKTRGRRVH